MSNWKLMGEAPRDGTEIVAKCGGHYMVVSWVSPGSEHWIDDGEYDPEDEFKDGYWGIHESALEPISEYELDCWVQTPEQKCHD